jgi:hypothetical protein
LSLIRSFLIDSGRRERWERHFVQKIFALCANRLATPGQQKVSRVSMHSARAQAAHANTAHAKSPCIIERSAMSARCGRCAIAARPHALS